MDCFVLPGVSVKCCLHCNRCSIYKRIPWLSAKVHEGFELDYFRGCCEFIDICEDYNSPTRRGRVLSLTESFKFVHPSIKNEVVQFLLVLARYKIKMPKDILNMIFDGLFGPRRNPGSLQICLKNMFATSEVFRSIFPHYLCELDIRMSARRIDFNQDETDVPLCEISVSIHENDDKYPQTAYGKFLCTSEGEIRGDSTSDTICDRYNDGFCFSLKDIALDLFEDDYRKYKQHLRVLSEIRVALNRTIARNNSDVIIKKMYDIVDKEHLGHAKRSYFDSSVHR